MSLMKTLAKVAIGVAIAKGVGAMASKGRASSGGGGLLGQLGGQSGSGSGGGLEDMLGSVLGGRSTQSGSSGSAGGLGGLLEGLSQSSTPSGGATAARSQGGLDDLLGGLAGQAGDADGGLMGALGGLLGGAGAGGALGGLMGQKDAAPIESNKNKKSASHSKNSKNSFAEQLNRSLAGEEPEPTPQQEVAAGLMLRAMIQAAKCDGRIDDAERQKLLGKLGDVSAAERDFVNAELAAPIDIQGLARQVPKGLEPQVYAMSVMGIDLDSQAEAQYLNDFAQALGLGKADVNNIHAQLGVPALYA